VLEQNLVDLGADPEHAITINGAYDAATANAVNRLMTAHGGTAESGRGTEDGVKWVTASRRTPR
jgi:hypothetical protein